MMALVVHITRHFQSLDYKFGDYSDRKSPALLGVSDTGQTRAPVNPSGVGPIVQPIYQCLLLRSATIHLAHPI